MMKATTDKPKKRSSREPRRWVAAPQSSARNAPAVYGVALTENESVRWTWTHTAKGSYVSGYEIVRPTKLLSQRKIGRGQGRPRLQIKNKSSVIDRRYRKIIREKSV